MSNQVAACCVGHRAQAWDAAGLLLAGCSTWARLQLGARREHHDCFNCTQKTGNTQRCRRGKVLSWILRGLSSSRGSKVFGSCIAVDVQKGGAVLLQIRLLLMRPRQQRTCLRR
jgi:hypothetical protein